MKKNIIAAALMLAPVLAQAAALSTVRVTGVPKLPSFPMPIITIKPEIQLPSPIKKAVLTPTLRLQSQIVIAVPNNARIGETVTVKILPAIPLQFPGRKTGNNGIQKLGAFFDGAKDEPKPVVVPQTTQPEKLPVPVKIEEIITKGRNYTLPERTLEDEIGI